MLCALFLCLEISASPLPPSLSPAERKIASVKSALAAKPGQSQTYNELAVALLRRARETSDASYYDSAEEALKQSLKLAPGNFEAQRTHVSLLLARHDFAGALNEARSLNKRLPDDVLVYGLMSDAAVALGDYETAEKATQKMLDLRSNNAQALIHGAILRDLFGDVEGGVQLMSSAYLKSSQDEPEERAWLLTRTAEMQLRAGKITPAEELAMNALSQFPEYPFAVKALAKIRMAQSKWAEAATLLQKLAPSPANLYLRAQALERGGEAKSADLAFSDFERKARAEIEQPRNANRELVFYYADRVNKPTEALRIARVEIARRQDIDTLDAFAWALYVNGDYAEARKQIARIETTGVRDAGFAEHASRIAAKIKP